MNGVSEIQRRAQAMRAEFDAGFAEPPGQVLDDRDDVLVVGLGDEQQAIVLSEVAWMSARPPITAVPTRHPAMLGVVSNRGSVAATWDLGRLLGGPAQHPRWLVVPAVEPGVAISFEHFAGFRRVETFQSWAGRILSLAGLVQQIRETCGQTVKTEI